MQDPLMGPLVHGLGLGILFPFIFLLFLVWTLAWKAIALWHAARHGQRGWFVALLVLNSVGILEIIYLLYFAKDDTSGDRSKIFPFLKDIRAMVSARPDKAPPVSS